LNPSDPQDHKILTPAFWRRTVISIGISFLLLFLLWLLANQSGEVADKDKFFSFLDNVIWTIASWYIVAALLGTWLRAERYRTLLRADGVDDLPGSWSMYLITLSRNMFVDMVPARIGELSYVLMLNRGHKVRVSSCLSTLFISVVLDIVMLAIMLLVLVIISFVAISKAEVSTGNAMVVATIFMIIAGLLIYWAAPLSHLVARLLVSTGSDLLRRLGNFLVEIGESIRRIELREMLSVVMLQSLGIRLTKYGGLYLLFIAVTAINSPGMAELPWWQVIPAFISSEAAASLPLPTFMSFGTYESGGVLAFSVFGFAAAEILLVVFIMHLLSQVVDYILGTTGLLLFLLLTDKRKHTPTNDKN
jgi:hypothetical protein